VTNPDCITHCLAYVTEHANEHVTETLIFENGSFYELFVTPYLLSGEIIGRVLNFRDITDRKMAEEAMKNPNQKLLLLSSITRHDILNQITRLMLYLNPVEEETTGTSIHVRAGKYRHV